MDGFAVYWNIENGTESNISTLSSTPSYRLASLTPATMYYISVEAVVGIVTSNRSEVISAGTGTS